MFYPAVLKSLIDSGRDTHLVTRWNCIASNSLKQTTTTFFVKCAYSVQLEQQQPQLSLETQVLQMFCLLNILCWPISPKFRVASELQIMKFMSQLLALLNLDSTHTQLAKCENPTLGLPRFRYPWPTPGQVKNNC